MSSPVRNFKVTTKFCKLKTSKLKTKKKKEALGMMSDGSKSKRSCAMN